MRKKAQYDCDALLAESNQLSRTVGELMKAGNKAEAEAIRSRSAAMKDEIKSLEEKVKQLEAELQQHLYQIPNAPYHMVPEGRGAEDNLEIRKGGSIPSLPENALPHWELAAKYNLIDFELGVKITGAGFPVYKSKMARLQRAW